MRKAHLRSAVRYLKLRNFNIYAPHGGKRNLGALPKAQRIQIEKLLPPISTVFMPVCPDTFESAYQ